jgi:O-antigen ligase
MNTDVVAAKPILETSLADSRTQDQPLQSEHVQHKHPGLVLGLCGILAFGVLTVWMPWSWPTYVQQLVVFLMASAWAVQQIVRPEPLTLRWLLIPVGIAATCGPLQLLTAHTVYRFATLCRSLEWVSWAVALFLAMQVMSSEENARLFRRLLGLFACLFCIFSYVQFLTSDGRIFWLVPAGTRILGSFVDPDQYASFVELVFPLVIYRMRRSGISWLYCVMAAVMFASVIAGKSRAGAALISGELFLTVLLVWAHNRSRRQSGITAIVLTALLLTSLVISDWGPVYERLQNPNQWGGRRELNISTRAMFRERPLTGWGLGTWVYVYPAYAVSNVRGGVSAAHNDWAQWAAEGGVFLFLAMLTLFVWSAVAALRAPWAMGIPFFFVHCTVDFPMQSSALGLWLFVMLGALAAPSMVQEASPTRNQGAGSGSRRHKRLAGSLETAQDR